MDLHVNIGLHALVLTGLARGAPHFHLAAVGIHQGPPTLLVTSRERVPCQIFLLYTFLEGPGVWRCPKLGLDSGALLGRHLVQPGLEVRRKLSAHCGGYGHLPKTSLDVKSWVISTLGKYNSCQQTNCTDDEYLSHFNPPLEFVSIHTWAISHWSV
jgi:hypothetical protein